MDWIGLPIVDGWCTISERKKYAVAGFVVAPHRYGAFTPLLTFTPPPAISTSPKTSQFNSAILASERGHTFFLKKRDCYTLLPHKRFSSLCKIKLTQLFTPWESKLLISLGVFTQYHVFFLLRQCRRGLLFITYDLDICGEIEWKGMLFSLEKNTVHSDCFSIYISLQMK